MAANDLCTLVDLKDWLNIPLSNTVSDAKLARLITAGSTAFLSRLKRNDSHAAPGTFTLYQQTITELYSGGGGDVLLLRCWPVSAIQSVRIGTAYLWGNGFMIPQAGVGPGWSFEPNDERILKLVGGYRFTPGTNNVEVSYTNGYNGIGELPMDIQQAVIEICGKKYRQKDAALGQDSASMSNSESLHFSPRDFTKEVWDVIKDYLDRVPR